MVYQSSQPQAPLPLKSNNKFEILLVKIFTLKQNTNPIHPATKEKIKIYLFKKTASGQIAKKWTEKFQKKCKNKKS